MENSQTSGRGSEELGRLTRAALLAALAAYLLLTVYLVWRIAVLEPYSDMYDWVDRLLAYRAGGPLGQYLLVPHNFHRLVSTFGLMDLDVRFFGGNNLLLLAMTLAALAAVAWILAREAAAATRPLALAAGTLAAMLALLGGMLHDAAIHINAQYVHALFFAVLAMSLAEPARCDAGLSFRHALALACAAAAPFCNAVGLAVWPVLVYGALRSGQDRRWLAICAASAVLLIGFYVLGQTGTGAPSPLGWTARDALSAIHLAFAYLGLPFTRIQPAVGTIIGLVAALAGTAIMLLKGGAKAARAERLAARFVLFTLGTALMAALGRTGVDVPSNVPLRYVAFVVPLHVGVLMLLAPWAERLWRARPRAIEAGLVVAMAAMLGLQAAMGLTLVHISDAQKQMIADFKAGLRNPEMLSRIHPDLERARSVQDRMDAAGLYQQELRPVRPRPPQ